MQTTHFVIIKQKKRCPDWNSPAVQTRVNQVMAVCFCLGFVIMFSFAISSVFDEKQERGDTTLAPDMFLAPTSLKCTEGYLDVVPHDCPLRIVGVSEGVVDIHILVSTADRALVWFHQHSNITSQAQWDAESQHNGCAASLLSTLRIEALLPTTLYTFCLMTMPEMTVSMFDCTSFLVPPQYTDLVWLSTADRPQFIAYVFVYLLCLFVLSAGITFWAIQRRPELLGPHQRLVFIDNQAKNILVMPRDYAASKKVTNIEHHQQRLANDKNNYLNYYGGKPRIQSFNISPDNNNGHKGKDYQDYDNANYIITENRSSGSDKMPYMRKGSSTPSQNSDQQRPLPAIPKVLK